MTYVIALGQFSHIIAGSAEAAFAVFTGKASIGEYFTRFFLPTLIGNLFGESRWPPCSITRRSRTKSPPRPPSKTTLESGMRSPFELLQSSKSAAALRLGQWLRFPSPLVKPDVRFCRIRLSDRLHVRLMARAAGLSRVKCCTPSFPKTSFQENARLAWRAG
jgi:hypothetical protein